MKYVPEYTTYEGLWLWPRDDEGNQLIPEDYDLVGLWIDNGMYVICWGFLCMAGAIMVSVLHGLIT